MRTLLVYIIRRLIQLVFTLAVVATLIFFMFRLMPGDITAAMIDPSFTKEAREQAMSRYGLDQSLGKQYVLFMKDLTKLEFGQSFYYKRPTVDVLVDKLPATLILMFSSMFVAYGVGVLGGCWLAWRRGRLVDTFWTSFALLFRSAPIFWVGIMLIYFFSVKLGWLPSAGMRSPGYQAQSTLDLFLSIDFLLHLLLPMLVTSLFFLATPLLVMRTSMLEVLGEDFIELARAKGLSERTVMCKHAARNALLPVVTTGALFIGSAVGGQVLIEYVFSWPGLGQEMVLAVGRHDYPLAQTAFILLASLIMLMNLVADIAYALLDPRISYD